MACNNLNSILKDCNNNVGGIYNIYINDTDNISATTVNTTGATITAMGVTTNFTTFEFKRNVGSVTIEPTVDLINGSTFYTATVTLVLHRREASKSRALTVLAEGQRYLDIMFLDANGLYWLVDHAQLNGGAEETGTVKADGSKYTVTFVAEMTNRPYQVDSSIVAALIA